MLKKKITLPKVFAPSKFIVKSFLDEMFQIESAEYINEIRHEGWGDVLLTGATGFLGIHVLCDLLKNTMTKVFCLVRKDKVESATARLKKTQRLSCKQKILCISVTELFIRNGTSHGYGN